MSHETYDNPTGAAFRRCQAMILKHAPLLMKVGDAVGKRRTRVPFSELEIARMRTLFTGGKNATMVAEILGREKNAVQKVFAKWRKHGAT